MAHGNMKKIISLAAAVALIGLTPTFSGTASASDRGMIRNGENARCLDAASESLWEESTKVQLWDCHGVANQLWYFDEYDVIRNHANGKCLDADLKTIGENGTLVQLWDCHADPNQRWHYDPSRRTLVNEQSGRCLDAELESINELGTRVQLWDCHGDSNQRWYF
ncbi:RICIN domain-containing protein [Lentzea sp. E54]|uniref:RICIN domain-containing protein n=1 Tax=Lentzea xerophila TaxID=3435883 RepID=UPI003DA1D9A0